MKKKVLLITVTLSSLLAAVGFVGSTMIFNKGMFVTADGNQVVNGQITFSGSTAVDDNWGHGAYSLSQTDYGNPIYCVSYKNSSAVPSNYLAYMNKTYDSYLYFAKAKIKWSDTEATKYAFQCIESITITTNTAINRSFIISYSYDGTSYTDMDPMTFNSSGVKCDLQSIHPNYLTVKSNSSFETGIKSITIEYTCQ